MKSEKNVSDVCLWKSNRREMIVTLFHNLRCYSNHARGVFVLRFIL